MSRQLGPICEATIVAADITAMINSYTQYLAFSVHQQGEIDAELAEFWQAPNLVGNSYAILQAANGNTWLRLVEDPSCLAVEPLKHHGWMSLEVNVANVDKLRENLDEQSPFIILGEPAYLELSDAIKACQIAGPAGEVLYLTEIQAQVPPFELPQTQAEMGDLFIPVLSSPNREAALNFYQELNQNKGLSFNTKITVLNKTWGYNINQQYPVATIQLNGNCLFELDEVADATAKPQQQGHLPAGIAVISVQVPDVSQYQQHPRLVCYHQQAQHRGGKPSCLLRGAAGELIELVGINQ